MKREKMEEPYVVRVKDEDLDVFNTLVKDPGSPFKKLVSAGSKKAVFLMAMAVGFCEGRKEELKDIKTRDYDRVSYLDAKEKALIKAIAVADKNGDLHVLLNPKEVYSIAEAYAAGGIKLLKNKVFSGEFGSYIKRLEAELLEKNKKNKTTLQP